MFTGIVEERGRVASVEVRGSGARIVVDCHAVASDARVGDSIAVNGVCLTVVERTPERLAFDLAPETMARTTLGHLGSGDPLNLERPLTLASRLGGHLVQGHVDGVGTVAEIRPAGGGSVMSVEVPGGLGR